MQIREKKSAFDYILFILLLGLIFITVYPFLNVLAISLNDPMDTMRNVNFIIPRKFTWSNYEYVFSKTACSAPLLSLWRGHWWARAWAYCAPPCWPMC